MSVRIAEKSDIPAILDLGERFHAMSPWRDKPFDRDATQAVLQRLIEQPEGVLLYNGHGMIGGVLSQIYFGGGLIAQELFWFADKGGRDLIKAFEAWAFKSGASGIVMVNLNLNPRKDRVMGKMYERRGYALRERHYYKDCL